MDVKKLKDTYCYYEEIKPAPGVCEEFDKSIGTPFQQHFKDEDVGEDFISIFQASPYGLPLLNVNVLKGLESNMTTIIITV